MVDDLISRQTDCVLNEFGNCSYSETGCADCEVKASIRNALSAQWKCKRMYTDVSDTISRQAAIDAIMGQPPEPHYPSWYAAQIEALPAVQTEYKEESPEEVAFAIAPFNIWSTAGWINVLNELCQYGYAICRREVRQNEQKRSD